MTDDLTPLQPADPQQGWPRVVARRDPGGVTLLAFTRDRDVTATAALGLTAAGVAALVRWYARRYPARFADLAKDEIMAAWRGALEEEREAGADG